MLLKAKRCSKCNTITNNFSAAKSSYCRACVAEVNHENYARRRQETSFSHNTLKLCTKCGKHKPYTKEHWYASRGACKACVRDAYRHDRLKVEMFEHDEMLKQVESIDYGTYEPFQACGVCGETYPNTGEFFNAPETNFSQVLFTRVCRKHAEVKQYARCVNCNLSYLHNRMIQRAISGTEDELNQILYCEALCPTCAARLSSDGKIELLGQNMYGPL